MQKVLEGQGGVCVCVCVSSLSRPSLGLLCTITFLSRIVYHPNPIFQLLRAGTLGKDVVSGFLELTETHRTGLAILM